MNVLSLVVALVLGVVSLLHFYWAFGGFYGLRSAGPKLEGRGEFSPSKFLTFIVACLIAFLALLAILLAVDNRPLGAFLSYCGYTVSLVFIVRAIGEFKYLGFFKKVYNSNFSKNDTLFFSPLCLLLGLAFFALAKHGA